MDDTSLLAPLPSATPVSPGEHPLPVGTDVKEPTADEVTAYGLGPNGADVKARAPKDVATLQGPQAAAPGDDFGPPEPVGGKDDFGAPEPVNPISVYPNGPDSKPLQVAATAEKADTYLADAYSAWLAHNQETDPAKRVDVLRYSALTGIPAQMLEPHLDDVKKELGTQALTAALARRPTLAKYLADASKAPLVKDDAAALGGLEWWLGKWDLMPEHPLGGGINLGHTLMASKYTPGAPEAALVDAAAEQLLTVPLETLHTLGLQQKVLGLDDTSASIVEDVLEGRYGNKDYGARNWLTEHALSVVKMAPYLVGNIATRAAGAAAGAIGGGGAGAETGPGAVGTAIGGGAVGEYGAGVAYDFFQQAGPTFRNLRNLTDDSGNPLLSENEARAYALAASGASSIVTGWLGGKLMRALGAGELLDRMGGGAIQKALAEKSVGQAVKTAAVRIGTSATEGALYSTVPAVATATAQELAKHEHGQAASLGNIVIAGRDAFVQGFQDMALLGSIGAGREFLGSMADAHRISAGAKQLEAQVAAARQSKLAAAHPGEFESFVSQAQGDNPQSLYADTAGWDAYWQGQRLDPRELAATLLRDGGQAYDEAKATGGRLAIPQEKYLASLARTPHHEKLRDDIAFAPDAPTVNQARKTLEVQAQQVADAGRAPDDGADVVHREWQAMGLGARERPEVADAVAQLAAHAFRRLGEHFGWTAEETYRKAGKFEIAGALGERLPEGLDGSNVEPGSRPAMRAAWLERNPDLQSRIGDYFRDELTGLYNERGFAALPPDKARPVNARFEVNGGKALNDFHGHESLDGGLRMVGQALRDAGIPDAAKIGGDIHARVQSEAHAKDLAAEMSKRLGVPVSVFTHAADATPEAMKAAGDAYSEWKKVEVEAGRLGPRNGLPPGFMPEDAPAIDWAASTEKGETPREGALAYDAPEAKDAIARGAEGLEPIAERMKQAPALEPADITPRHVSAFEESLLEKDPFDTIHVDKDGALTGRGFALAQDVAPKAAQLSGDIRGVGDMNKEAFFGRHATDQILSHVIRKMVENGGGQEDVARPHGDEFYAQSNDPERLDTIFRRTDEHLKKTVFFMDRGDGTAVLQEGVRLAYGIARRTEGESAQQALKRADADLLPAAKSEQRGLAKPRVLPTEDVGPALERARNQGLELVRVEREAGALNQGRAGGAGTPSSGGEGGGQAGGGEGLQVVLEKKGRGYLRVTGPDGARRYSIRLLEDADATTQAHEFAHAFSQVLADFAGKPNAPESLRKEYGALTKWMGYDSPREREEQLARRAELAKKKSRTSAEESEFQAITAKEEKLSHAFEQYLAEGKPPSAPLARPFQRFRNWVLRAYKAANGPAAQYLGEYGRKLEFSDDVRQMLDRWFTAESAVSQASAPRGDVFAALREKMTPEERAHDDALAQAARESAATEVVRRIAEAQHEEVHGFISKEREKVRDEVKGQMEAIGPKATYAALRFLQDGDTVATPGETPEVLQGEGGQQMKLSRPEAVKLLGADVVKTLPRGLFATKGDDAHAMSADGMAGFFGFDSGKQMLEAIRDAVPRQQAIEAETQRRMEERFGPELLADAQRLAEVAAQAVDNEADLRRTFHAIQSLRRQMGMEASPVLSPEGAKALAAKYVDAKTVGELARGDKGLAGTYRRNAETAARRAADFFRADKKDKAEAELGTMVLNQAMAKRAGELRAEMEKGRAKLEQLSKDASRKAMGKADPAFLSASDAVLQALGLAKPQDGMEPPSIEPLVALAGENLQGLFAFDADLMRRLVADKTPWKKLSISEARAVVEGLTNIRHVAGQTNFLDLTDKRLSADEFFAQLQREVEGSKRKPVAPEDLNEHVPTTVLQKAGKAYKGFKADLTEMGNIIAKLGPRDGVAARLFIDARREARDKEVTLKRDILSKVTKLYEKLPKELQRGADDEVPVKLPLPPDPDRPMGFTPTRKWLWALFLNWGAESNRQRIRDGNGWTDEQVQSALNLLTPAEGEYLQGILDVTNGLFPELAKVHQARTGLPLEKVKSSPIRIGDKELAGGYSPLKYDVRFSGDVARRQVASEIDKVQSNNFRSPVSNGSYTHARAEKVDAAVRISWDTIPAHLAEVAHDIAYGDWVRQVASLLNDRQGRFDKVLNTHLGPELAAQFRPWLADVARDKADSLAGATAPFWEGASAKLRRFAAMGSTMFNVASYGRHLFDPFAARAKDVPMWRIAESYAKAVADWGARRLGRPGDEYRAALYGTSQVLRYREASHENGIRKAFEEAGVKQGLSGAMVRMDAHVRAGIGRVVDETLFLASHQHALSEGMSPDEARRFADDVVSDTTPSFDVAERPALLRSKRSIAGAVMLMGYRAKMFGLHERAWDESGAKGAATTLQLIALGAVGSLFLHMGKRDDESWGRFGWEQTLQETFGLIPLAGDIAVAMLQGKNIDASRLPEARAAAEVGDALTRIVTKWGDGEAGADKAWEAITLYLALSGGPVVAANQAKRAVTGR